MINLTEMGNQSLLSTWFPTFLAKAFQADGWTGNFVAMKDALAEFAATINNLVVLPNDDLHLVGSSPIVVA